MQITLQIIRKVIDNHSQLLFKTGMIYCLCRQINTEKVDFAASCGAKTAKCVLAHYGEKFNCGKCACSIQERLNSKSVKAVPLAAE